MLNYRASRIAYDRRLTEGTMQHFSDYSEAYVDPGDVVTKGVDFLAEAERLREEEPVKLSLAYLQGTLLLYER